MAVSIDDVVRRYSTLYHMAEPGSWPSIRDRGLLGTSALLDLYGITGSERSTIEGEHRPESVLIRRPGLPDATIRDQKPMSVKALTRVLDPGVQPSDWFRELNSKVFFWVRRERLKTMMNARAYRKMAKTVLEVDAAALLTHHAHAVRLATINTGATHRFAARRGRRTFLDLGAFPKGRLSGVVELVVEIGVPRICEFVTHVYETDANGVETLLWRRP